MSLPDQINIRFLGAALTVTGSKYLLTFGSKKILVDCGLFQGMSSQRVLNWEPLPVQASDIDLVLLTHGHLDHTGYLPRLVKEGFTGEIWGTAPTIDVAKIILRDSARIQEEDAAQSNREGYSKHHPALPLYNVKDAEKTFPLFQAKILDEWIPIDENSSCRFRYNGHIIGATFIELKIKDKTIVFSGDIGRPNDPLLRAPEKPVEADVLLIESTYGNTIHRNKVEESLAGIVNRAMAKRGTLIIPGFAVERAQMLLYFLYVLKQAGKIPAVPVYLDSPMGTDAMEVFLHYPQWHKLSPDLCRRISSETKITRTIQDTSRIMNDTDPKVMVAGSGMVSGGRVLSYLARYIGDPAATVLLAGYQAEGTRGRALLEGASEIKMFGKYFPVKAAIENLEGISAHADQGELLDWLSKIARPPKKIFIVHGEKSGAESLQKKIAEKYGFDCTIATPNLEYRF
jgi:metallo-beta-lactamase family protein